MNPSNEISRLQRLSDLDLDYTDARESLNGFTQLAARITGASISLINLVDAFTQWSVSSYGFDIEQMAREDSVCQYTILSKEGFEVKDLTADDRFRDKSYVTGGPKVRYYFGVPLQTSDGFNIGALCILDRIGKELDEDTVEQLRLLANEIVAKLTLLHVVQRLKGAAREARDNQRKVAHDIRGPLGGIIQLSQLITSQGEQNRMEEVLNFVNMIQKTDNSLLELADEILNTPKTDPVAKGIPDAPFTMQLLKEKLEKLYGAQASPKNIGFSVQIVNGNETLPIKREKLLQIAGNLISNAIKFTAPGGRVQVELELQNIPDQKKLWIRVRDTGEGMDAETIQSICEGSATSTNGTDGETGYGLGLVLVRSLVAQLNGSINITSNPGEGTQFEITLPQ